MGATVDRYKDLKVDRYKDLRVLYHSGWRRGSYNLSINSTTKYKHKYQKHKYRDNRANNVIIGSNLKVIINSN